MSSNAMTPAERRTVFSLASIYALRMLGLLLLLPVIALYATSLQGSTPLLVGLSLGIYGLTQAIFQIPFGALSDRYGRKPLITIGLLIFIAGSVLAALSPHIYGLILGRALQGTGAISSAILALLADLTRVSQRTKAMAAIGISIGGTFALSFIISPMLTAKLGVPSIFWLTVILSIGSLIVLYTLVPTPPASVHVPTEPMGLSRLKRASQGSQLWRLYASIFLLHCSLALTFLALPFVLTEQLNLVLAQQWQLYLPVLLLSFGLMLPLILLAEKRHRVKEVFLIAIGLMVLGQLGFWILPHLWGIAVSLLIYFVAFNLLEAQLPAWTSKIAPQQHRGTAMGIYSMAQFVGIFIGGVFGGGLVTLWGINIVFLISACLMILWFIIALGLQRLTPV